MGVEMLKFCMFWSCVGFFAFVMMAIPTLSMKKEIAQPDKTKTTVYIKQINGINPLIFKDCVMLAERVEC